MASPHTLASSLENLSLKKGPKNGSKPAESWEDDAEDDVPSAPRTPARADSSNAVPKVPPPTPASPQSVRSPALSPRLGGPQYQSIPEFGPNGTTFDNNDKSEASSSRDGGERRPEKSTAVASRLIAAGIGQKAPKRTKEQREYDQAMKVQEKKKRDAAKEEEEKAKQAKEKAKQAMWDD